MHARRRLGGAVADEAARQRRQPSPVVSRARAPRRLPGPITTASGRPGALERDAARPPLPRRTGPRPRSERRRCGRGRRRSRRARRLLLQPQRDRRRRRDGVYRPLELDWGSFGIRSRRPRRSSAATSSSARDARLEERFTPHVLSFEPVRLWYCGPRRRPGRVARQQPTFVRRRLSHLLAPRRELLRRPDHATLDLRGLQGAIAGDRLLLGEPPGVAPPAVLRALRRLGD